MGGRTGTGFSESAWIIDVALPALAYAVAHPKELKETTDRYAAVHPTEGIVATGNNQFTLAREIRQSGYEGRVLIEERDILLGLKPKRASPEVAK